MADIEYVTDLYEIVHFASVINRAELLKKSMGHFDRFSHTKFEEALLQLLNEKKIKSFVVETRQLRIICFVPEDASILVTNA